MNDSARPSFTINELKHFPVAIVAGGAGFLGSFLCESLLQQNLIVVVLDNLATGKKSYIQHLLKLPNFIFYEHDLNKPLPENLKSADYVFHLAGIEEYLNGVDMTMETLLVNSIGSQHLLELCKNTNAKFLLTSAIDVYSGAMSSENINRYFGFGVRDDKRYAHHEAKRYAEALTTEYFKKFQINVRIARIADVYGPKMDLEAGTIISTLVKEAITSETLTIHGDGLKQIFPVFVTDVVEGINKAMFGKNTEGKIYTLASPNPTTTINFAYELQKQSEKKLHIVFAPEIDEITFQQHKTDLAQTKQDLSWEPQTQIGEGIKKTLDWFNTNGKNLKEEEKKNVEELFEQTKIKELQVKKQEKKDNFKIENLALKINIFAGLKKINPFQSIKNAFGKISKNTTPKRIPIIISFVIILTLLLYPITNLGFHAWYAYANLNSTENQLKEGKFEDASVSAQKAEDSFQSAENQLKNLNWLLTMTNLREKALDFQKLIYVGEDVSSSAKYLSTSALLIKDLSLNNQNNNQNLIDTIAIAKLNLDSSYENISRAEASIKLIQPEKYPKILADKISSAKGKIPQTKDLIEQTRSFLQVAPEFIGLNGKRTYLVLFQNNNELRATGGFIGSYGLFTFNNGKLEDWKVEDVYNADGQLKGYVEPPPRLKQFLKNLSPNPDSANPTWTLRDSNWDPDFSVSAQTAEWFLAKETGINVDGVIAVDLTPLSYLLEETGGIYLSDNNITITKDNLFLEIEKHQLTFFPGSTKKKDFLYELTSQLFQKFSQPQKESEVGVIMALNKSITEKHLLAYFHDYSLNLFAEKLNIDGKIKNTQGDSIFVVDTNIGANKTNQHIRRTINENISLETEKDSTHSLEIKYENLVSENQAIKDSFDYKNYLRVYLPQKSTVEKIEVGGVGLSPTQYDTASSAGKLMVGLLVNVPYKTKETVNITYKTKTLDVSNPQLLRYNLFVQKQPGTTTDFLNIAIKLPEGWKMRSENQSFIVKDKSLYYNTPLNTDKTLLINLQKE